MDCSSLEVFAHREGRRERKRNVRDPKLSIQIRFCVSLLWRCSTAAAAWVTSHAKNFVYSIRKTCHDFSDTLGFWSKAWKRIKIQIIFMIAFWTIIWFYTICQKYFKNKNKCHKVANSQSLIPTKNSQIANKNNQKITKTSGKKSQSTKNGQI